MDNASPQNSIYVVIIDQIRNITSMGTVQFLGNKSYLTVAEIFDFFKITLGPGMKVWIKRRDQTDCRKTNFERGAALPWEHFNNCIMVISYQRPNAEIFQNYHQSLAEKKFSDDLELQKRLWKEKGNKKTRGNKTSLRAARKNKLVRNIRKRKIRLRIEAEKNIEKKEK